MLAYLLLPGYVFGGCGPCGTLLGDLWSLQLGTTAATPKGLTIDRPFSWSPVATMGVPPAPRFDHAAFAAPTQSNCDEPDVLCVVGGRDLSGPCRDCCTLDLKTMAWGEPRTAGNGLGPAPLDMFGGACHDVGGVPYHSVREQTIYGLLDGHTLVLSMYVPMVW